MKRNTRIVWRTSKGNFSSKKFLNRVRNLVVTGIFLVSGSSLAVPVVAEEIIEEQVVTGVRGKQRVQQRDARARLHTCARAGAPERRQRERPAGDSQTFGDFRPRFMDYPAKRGRARP